LRTIGCPKTASESPNPPTKLKGVLPPTVHAATTPTLATSLSIRAPNMAAPRSRNREETRPHLETTPRLHDCWGETGSIDGEINRRRRRRRG
jgi:hypothetical protein